MPKDDKTRVHIHLYTDDWNALGVIFGSSLGKSEAVRNIVHDYIKRITAKSAPKQTPVELSNDEFRDILSGLPSGGDQPS